MPSVSAGRLWYRTTSLMVESVDGAFSGTMDWRLGGLDLTTILAYTKVERLQEEDTDMNPFAFPADDSAGMSERRVQPNTMPPPAKANDLITVRRLTVAVAIVIPASTY